MMILHMESSCTIAMVSKSQMWVVAIAKFPLVNTTIGYAVADYQWGWNVIDWVDGWPTI